MGQTRRPLEGTFCYKVSYMLIEGRIKGSGPVPTEVFEP